MGKQSKVSSSAKWRLRENVVLQLMECLTPSVSFEIFMGNYFTSFRLLINIRATSVLNKNIMQMHYHWGQTAAKKERANLEQHTSGKKAV